jgi:hypothetical protein
MVTILIRTDIKKLEMINQDILHNKHPQAHPKHVAEHLQHLPLGRIREGNHR